VEDIQKARQKIFGNQPNSDLIENQLRTIAHQRNVFIKRFVFMDRIFILKKEIKHGK
jgi:hypothetical protein